MTLWDWYATFAALAGVDATDHRAAMAHLPPIDSYDMSQVLLGRNLTSPRTEIPIGTEPRASNLSGAPLCISYDATPYYHDPRVLGDEIAAPPLLGRCTTLSGVIVDEGAAGLWKLLTGNVEQAVYTGPHSPNASTDMNSAFFVGHCSAGCLYNLRDDPLEEHDLAAEMPAKADALRAKVWWPSLTHWVVSCISAASSTSGCGIQVAVNTNLSCIIRRVQVVAYGASAFNPRRGKTNPAACRKALGSYGGFWGPFVA